MKRGARDEAAVTHSCAAAASARDVREISGMGEGGDVTAGSSPLKVVGARGAQTRRRTQPASTPRAQALLSSPAPAAPPGWSRRASPAARGSEPARLPAPSAPGRGVLPAPPPAAVRPVTPVSLFPCDSSDSHSSASWIVFEGRSRRAARLLLLFRFPL